MSSSGDALERLLAATDGAEATADAIIQSGWAPPANRAQMIELLAEHQSAEGGDGGDYDYYCECGKWLEWDIYDMPDHVSSILESANLLAPGRPWAKSPGGSK